MDFLKSTGFGVYAEQPVNQGKGETPWVKMGDTEVNFKVESITPSMGSKNSTLVINEKLEKNTELFIVDNKNNILDFKVDSITEVEGTVNKLDILENGSALETLPFNGSVNGLNNLKPKVVGKEQYIDSPFGKAFLFDGNTYINTNMKAFPKTVTISFWMKQGTIVNTKSNQSALFTFSKDGANTLNFWQRIGRDIMRFYCNNTDGYSIDKDKVYEDNMWHHYVVDSSGKVYIDGKLGLTMPNVDMTTINVNLVIGSDIDADSKGNISYNDFIQNGTAMAMFRLIQGSVTEEDVKKLMTESLKLNKIDLSSLNLNGFPKFIGKKQLPQLLVNTGNSAGDMVLDIVEEPIKIVKEDADSIYIPKPKLGEIVNLNGMQIPNLDSLPGLKVTDLFTNVPNPDSLVSLIKFDKGVKDLKGKIVPKVLAGNLDMVKDIDGISYNKFNGSTVVELPGLYQNGALNVNTVVFDFKSNAFVKNGFIFGASNDGNKHKAWYEFGEGNNKGEIRLYSGSSTGAWNGNGLTIKDVLLYDNIRHIYSVSIDGKGAVTVYRDSALVGIYKYSPIAYSGTDAGEVTIGQRYDNGWTHLKAFMSTMMIFNKVLNGKTLSYLTDNSTADAISLIASNTNLIKLDKTKFNIKDKVKDLFSNSMYEIKPLQIGVDSFTGITTSNLKLIKGSEVITDQGKVKITDVTTKSADSVLNILGDNSCIAAFPLTNDLKDLGNKYNLQANDVSIGSVAGYKALDLTGKDKPSETHTAVIKRNGSKEITISGWIYIKNVTGQWQSVWHLTPDGNDCDSNSRQPALWIHAKVEDGWHIRCDSSLRTNDGIDATRNHPTIIGKWIHIAQVVSDKTMQFYVNGEQIVNYTISGEFKHNDGVLYIGDKWYGKNFFIRDVKVFNKTLSKAEIRKLFNNDYKVSEIKYDKLPQPPKFIAIPNNAKHVPLEEVKFNNGQFKASFSDVTGSFTTLQRKVILPSGMELVPPIKTNLWKKK